MKYWTGILCLTIACAKPTLKEVNLMFCKSIGCEGVVIGTLNKDHSIITSNDLIMRITAELLS